MARIDSGPAHVVDTGMVTAFMGFPIQLTTVVDQVRFRVMLRMSSDPETDGVTVNSAYEDGILVLDCVNFDNADGRGSSRPVLLGPTEKNAVFFHFKLWRFGQTDDHTVHYTFFSADKEAIGFQPA